MAYHGAKTEELEEDDDVPTDVAELMADNQILIERANFLLKDVDKETFDEES